MPYIYQHPNWPSFHWDPGTLSVLLAAVRHQQGRLLGKMEGLGFSLQTEANLRTLTLDVLKSSEIEGENLNAEQVRSSIARRLGMDVAGLVPADRHVEGVVEMMMDATQNYLAPLSQERLFGWHAAMFPGGRSGMYKIVTGRYRDNTDADPMRVVSGPMGREKVHFEAPRSTVLESEMKRFLSWFNNEENTDPVLRAAVAHLWFVTIHPFDDGNGRMARAITDMQLSRADHSPQRFYSMSAQIRVERKEYYDILESTQKGSPDITGWISWFLNCLERALNHSEEHLGTVLRKARFWEKESAMALSERQRLMLNRLLDGFTGKLTSSKWAKITKVSQDTAGRDINDLLNKRILIREPKGGGRSTAYLLDESVFS